MIKLKTIFLFYSFMKHYKSDATQNILCGFKNLLKLFFSKKKMKGNFKMECYFKLNSWNAWLKIMKKEIFDSLKKLWGSFQSEALNKINAILQNLFVYLCFHWEKKKEKKQLKFFTNKQTLRAKRHVSTKHFLALQTRSAPKEFV